MDKFLKVDNQGILLQVMPRTQYDGWLENQSDMTKNWLQQTGFDGSGLALIAGSDGAIAQAIFVDEKPQDFFACGDLASMLPANQYLLQADAELLPAIAFSWAIGCYRFDRYKPSNKPQAVLAIDDKQVVEQALIQAQGVALVRDLVNTPAADMMPQHLAEVFKQLAQEFDADFSQIVSDDLLERNYPTIHAVGRASENVPRLLDLHWGDESHPKVTLVGKGVCFDSGGLDLKPAAGMRLMKKDMGGAAHVLGLAQIIMANQLPVRLRVLVPAVENAVSSNAMRPGDVITTRRGLTVEIEDTDAEGRLILCDALAEANNDSPDVLIDFATLTGAMRVALGTELPGFFSTNKQIARDLVDAGDKVTDPVWQMPLYQPYHGLFKSDIADMTNCPKVPTGGAICAALYLQAFVEDDIDWLHFDIMAWNTRKLSGRPVGGEAFGIRAVYQYLLERFA